MSYTVRVQEPKQPKPGNWDGNEIKTMTFNKPITDPIVFYDLEVEQTHNGFVKLWTLCIYVGYWVTSIGRYTNYGTDANIPYFMGRSKSSLLRFLSDMGDTYKRIYLFAFNGSGFDHLLLFNGCKIKDEYTTSSKIKSGIIELGKISIVLKDLMYYMSYTTVKQLGDQLKCPKLDVGNFINIKYCARDTVIIAKAWLEIICKMYEPLIGVLIPDISCLLLYQSQAQIAYNYMIHEVKDLYAMKWWHYDYGKHGYYGAKVDSMIYELEFIGEVTIYDFKSMYPASVSNKIPIGKCKFVRNVKFNWPEYSLYNYKPFMCWTHMSKKTNDMLDNGYGIIPVKDNNTLIYTSSGRIRGLYTCVDIFNALCDGWKIDKAYGFLIWEGWGIGFGDKIKYWYAKKQSYPKDTVLYWFYKNILNASIGYMAIKPPEKRDCTKINHVNWFCMSYARRQHVLLKKICIDLGFRYYLYSDTDSLVLPVHYINQLPDSIISEDLGSFDRITGDLEATDMGCIVLGKKLMILGKSKCSAKGHNKGQLDYEFFRRALIKSQFTTRESPICHVQVIKGVLHSTVSMFIKFKRVLKPTTPMYKQKINKIWVNKFIIVHYLHFEFFILNKLHFLFGS